jgi:putative ribosome biogenesis GTPase RsgA
LHHRKIYNADTVKMILQSCVPNLSDYVVEQILVTTSIHGVAHIVSCSEDDARDIGRCMIENGLNITIEDA